MVSGEVNSALHRQNFAPQRTKIGGFNRFTSKAS